VLTHASIVCEGMLASVNSVNIMFLILKAFYPASEEDRQEIFPHDVASPQQKLRYANFFKVSVK